MATLKAALFDLDGTLIDTEGQYTQFWAEAGRRYRPDIPDVAQLIKGTTLARILDTYFPDAAVRQTLRRELVEWELSMHYEFYPGVEAFLGDIRAHGIKCALVTSSDRLKMANVYRKQPRLRGFFDRILTSEDFAASKPDPDCYLRAAEALGCQKGECVVFEDALTGLRAGMSAGIFTIGMTTTNSRDAISPLCHCVLDGFLGFTYRRLLEVWDPSLCK